MMNIIENLKKKWLKKYIYIINREKKKKKRQKQLKKYNQMKLQKRIMIQINLD